MKSILLKKSLQNTQRINSIPTTRKQSHLIHNEPINKKHQLLENKNNNLVDLKYRPKYAESDSQFFSSSKSTTIKNNNKNKQILQNNEKRTPQMIKLMINELQKELNQKLTHQEINQKIKSKKQTKSNNNKSTNSIKKTKNINEEKLKLSNNVENYNNESFQILSSKNQFNKNNKKKTINSVKSPNKRQKRSPSYKQARSPNKQIKQSQGKEQKESPNMQINKKSPSKDLKNQQSKKKKKIVIPLNKKISRSKDEKQNYIILGDNLIQLNNVSIPLFIFNNSDLLNQKTKRNENSFNQIDEKSRFINFNHSKQPSTDVIKIDSFYFPLSQVRHIERSYISETETDQNSTPVKEANQSQILGSDPNLYQLIQSPIKSQVNSVNLLINKQQYKKEQTLNRIKFSLLVVKIQKWWRKIQFTAAKKFEKLSQIKQTINKKIVSNDEQHNLLKLRQNAAYVQFSTHQEILKDLYENKRINIYEFKQKISLVQDNLEKELNEINKIKMILKESANKVQKIIEKNKQVIQMAKLIKNQSNERKMTDSDINSQKINQANLFTKLFGKGQDKEKENEQLRIEQIKKSINNSDQLQRPTTRHAIYVQKKTTLQNQIKETDFQNSDNETFIFCKQNTEKQVISPISGFQYSPHRLNDKVDFTDQEQHQNKQKQQQNGQVKQQCQGFPIQNVNFEQMYLDYQLQEQTKKQIQYRIAKQLGMSTPVKNDEQLEKAGINTSIIGVHKFLLNFFKFYLYYHKDEFLKNMNMPYGESIEARVNKCKLPNVEYALLDWKQVTLFTEDDDQVIYGMKNVIPEEVLESFFQSYYQQTDIQFNEVERTNIELEKIHNRAIFHSFNAALNFFRPYYNIGGPPYLWCNSEKSLTFYFIGEENIQEVYEKTQMKLLKSSSYLCGLQLEVPHKNTIKYQLKQTQDFQIVYSPFQLPQANKNKKNQVIIENFEQYLHKYTQNFSPVYLMNLEERLKKKQLAEMQQQHLQWFLNTFEENKLSILLNLTDLIEQIILAEQCKIINELKQTQIQIKSESDIQYF